MNKKTENKKQKISGKQKVLIGSTTLLGVGALTVGLWSMLQPKDIQEDSPTEIQQPIMTDDVEEEDKPVVNIDERETLDQPTLDSLLRTVKANASRGQWGEIISSVSDYDFDYNLETTEDGEYLRELFLDANTLANLNSLGDTNEAVEEAVMKLPNLSTHEMYVLGLYFLPRNVMLDLSSDTLALAPTQRGEVNITNVEYIHTADEEGNVNSELENHEVITRYNQSVLANEFPHQYIRVDVQNGAFHEYAYMVESFEAPIELIGFYSDETGENYTTKTVGHYRNFTEMIQQGIDTHYNDEEIEE